MLDKDTFKRELVRMWNTLRGDEYKIYNACNGVSCSKCPLHGIGCSEPLSSYEVVEIVKKWSKEHPQKHKVSQLEYDILKIYVERELYGHFAEYGLLMALLKKGYFDGATGKTDVKEYFKNCEVKENDN